jgi:hypothetical protein
MNPTFSRDRSNINVASVQWRARRTRPTVANTYGQR